MLSSRTLLFMLATLPALVAGCSEPPRPMFNVSGNVTFRGKPVPAGTVTFLPNSVKGNLGPLVGAVIKNGQYDVRQDPKEAGSFGGEYVVVINGYDGRPGGETAHGNPIFREYRTEVALPPADSVKDFVVPGR